MAYRAGRVEAGLALAKRSMIVAEESKDEMNRMAPLLALAFYTLHDQVDYEAADRQYAEVADIGVRLWRQGLTANPAMIALAWRAFIALLQGDLSGARPFAEELQGIAERRNNPREKGSAASFLSLLQATAGDYQPISPSIFEAVAIGHTDFASYSLILNACGLGNVQAAIAGIIREWSQPIANRWPAVCLRTVPAAAFVLAQKGDDWRAAALLAMGRAHAACPHGWWEKMVLVQALDARLQGALSAENYAEAQARGREMDVGETTVALLEELEAMATTDG
jgi:hypothetical protein